jgi:hypothetical protein
MWILRYIVARSVRNGHTLESTLIPLVRNGHTLESMVEQTSPNNNGKQEINTQYLCGSAVCLHPRD